MDASFQPFLSRLTANPASLRLERLSGGANNRVFLVTADTDQWVLKQYYHHPNDPRDRFTAEHTFYSLIKQAGLSAAPESLGWDTTERLGLFTFISGRRLRLDEIDRAHVSAALDFVIQLNQQTDVATRQQLPLASEACFSLADHLACVDRRLTRLQQMAIHSAIDQEAANFIQGAMTSAWAEIKARIPQSESHQAESDYAAFASPSDYGFHNALLTSQGQLKFFDFEYAGQDDPAKLLCDFFCQPQLPVPRALWPEAVSHLTQGLSLPSSFARRASDLLPVYQFKWCCIMLNEFLATERHRREFAESGENIETRKAARLAAARQSLAGLAQEQNCHIGTVAG